MNKIVSGVIFVFCATFASMSMAELGIGAAVRSDVSSLYIPWQITPELRLEGEVSLYEEEAVDSGTLFLSLPGLIPTANNRDDELLEYGLAAFWTPALEGNWRGLLGMRLNYASQESSSSSLVTRTRIEMDGYEWSPTLGLEYALVDKIRLAIEYSYYRLDLDGDARFVSAAGSEKVNVERESSGTRTRIVLRYFF